MSPLPANPWRRLQPAVSALVPTPPTLVASPGPSRDRQGAGLPGVRKDRLLMRAPRNQGLRQEESA